MKKVWLGIAAVAMGIGACNVTVGECWPNGQGGGSAEVGVGAVGAVGAGGYGDTPPRGGTGANACNASSDSPSTPEGDATEASLKVLCFKKDWGQPCSERCFARGVGCVPLAVHPQKVDGGIGKLFSCNDFPVGFMCGYHYDNGDDCYYPFGLPFPKVCSYSGDGHN